MRIGDLAVDVPVLLAPMAAVTDLPFRTVCEEFGVGLTITEFSPVDALAADEGSRYLRQLCEAATAG